MSDDDPDDIDDLRNDLSRERVQEYLAGLPESRNFQYVLSMHELVEGVDDIVPVLRDILEHEEVGVEIRFSAFYGLCIYHYKKQSVNRLGALHEEFGSEFSNDAFYEFLYAVYLRERNNPGDLEAALGAFDRAVEAYPENPGILKGAANGYLTALENDATTRDETHLQDDAEQCIREAIRLYPDYAEYYADLGRLHKLRGEYELAEKEFDRAIDLENDEKSNYGVSIARYQFQKALSRLKQLEDEYTTEIAEVQAELDNIDDRSEEITRQFQTTVIQSISFFTGIVALVVTFVDVAITFSVQQAAQIVTVLIGGLVVAFGGMTAILPSEISLYRIALLYGTGMGLFLIGILWIVLG